MSNKRQTILDTATRLFYAYGYHAVGMDRIIAEAGIAKMTLYKNFASKTDLILAVLQERDLCFQASLKSYVGTFNEPLEKLQAIFMWHDKWFKEKTFNGCMFINAAAEYSNPHDSIHIATQQHKQAIQNFITTILKTLTTEILATKLGGQLLQILDGAIVTGLIFNDHNAALTAWCTTTALLKAHGLIY